MGRSSLDLGTNHKAIVNAARMNDAMEQRLAAFVEEFEAAEARFGISTFPYVDVVPRIVRERNAGAAIKYDAGLGNQLSVDHGFLNLPLTIDIEPPIQERDILQGIAIHEASHVLNRDAEVKPAIDTSFAMLANINDLLAADPLDAVRALSETYESPEHFQQDMEQKLRIAKTLMQFSPDIMSMDTSSPITLSEHVPVLKEVFLEAFPENAFPEAGKDLYIAQFRANHPNMLKNNTQLDVDMVTNTLEQFRPALALAEMLEAIRANYVYAMEYAADKLAVDHARDPRAMPIASELLRRFHDEQRTPADRSYDETIEMLGSHPPAINRMQEGAVRAHALEREIVLADKPTLSPDRLTLRDTTFGCEREMNNKPALER